MTAIGRGTEVGRGYEGLRFAESFTLSIGFQKDYTGVLWQQQLASWMDHWLLSHISVLSVREGGSHYYHKTRTQVTVHH